MEEDGTIWGCKLSAQKNAIVDKRRATWRLLESTRDDVLECFKGQSNLLSTLHKNAKTGPKIMKCDLVKREPLKTFVTDYLNFLRDWNENKIDRDRSRFYEDDILRCIKKYIPNGQKVDWTTLCEEVADAPKASAPKAS
jgi:hypothetical protein